MDDAGDSNESQAEGSKGKGMGGLMNRVRQKLKRWQNRTPAQQEANKAAQKRYRERKKGQADHLQAQADALAAQAGLPWPPFCVTHALTCFRFCAL
jgi:hypothetical protein